MYKKIVGFILKFVLEKSIAYFITHFTHHQKRLQINFSRQTFIVENSHSFILGGKKVGEYILILIFKKMEKI